jgi:hypothetical protein
LRWDKMQKVWLKVARRLGKGPLITLVRSTLPRNGRSRLCEMRKYNSMQRRDGPSLKNAQRDPVNAKHYS